MISPCVAVKAVLTRPAGLNHIHTNLPFPSELTCRMKQPKYTSLILMFVALLPASTAIGQGQADYQIIQGNFTWHQAKADAEARGGRLAVLNTQAKINEANAFLQGQASRQWLWIGLTDEVAEGQWKWINGDQVSANNWDQGEPNSLSGEHYAAIFPPPRITWNDAGGQNQNAYLLEVPKKGPVPNSRETPEEAFERVLGQQARRIAEDPQDATLFAGRLLDLTKKIPESPDLATLLCRKAFDFAIRGKAGTETALASLVALEKLDATALSEIAEKAQKVVELLQRSGTAEEKKQASVFLLARLSAAGDANLAAGKPGLAAAEFRKAAQLAQDLGDPKAAELLAKTKVAIASDSVAKNGDKPASAGMIFKSWDLATDFPTGNETNAGKPTVKATVGPWSFGWAEANKPGVFTPYDNTVFKPGEAVSMDKKAAPPAVWRNLAQSVRYGVQPGEVSLHGGQNQEMSIARWTSPVTGKVHVAGAFGAGHSGTVDVFIVKVSRGERKVLFKKDATATTEPFDLVVPTWAGDKLDFIVGTAGDYGADNTPLNVRISASR